MRLDTSDAIFIDFRFKSRSLRLAFLQQKSLSCARDATLRFSVEFQKPFIRLSCVFGGGIDFDNTGEKNEGESAAGYRGGGTIFSEGDFFEVGEFRPLLCNLRGDVLGLC